MATEFIDKIRKEICGEIEIVDLDDNMIQFVAPVFFDDGDSINVVLTRFGKSWFFTDQGDTLMHLSYMGLEEIFRGKRGDGLHSIMNAFDIRIHQGEFSSNVDMGDIGEAYFRFLHGLTRIVNYVMYTSKENVSTLFMEDFRGYLIEKFGTRCKFDYVNKEHDVDGVYSVDCVIEDKTRLFFFGIKGEAKCHTAAITCLMFKQWDIPFHSIIVFENRDDMNKKAVARIDNVADKIFSTLPTTKNQLPAYLEKYSVSMN